MDIEDLILNEEEIIRAKKRGMTQRNINYPVSREICKAQIAKLYFVGGYRPIVKSTDLQSVNGGSIPPTVTNRLLA